MINEIINIMRLQKEVYAKILDCAFLQQQAIVSAKTQDLHSANEKQLSLNEKATSLENERCQKVALLCQRLSLPSTATVSQICQVLDDKESKSLLEAANSLHDILFKLNEVNNLNAQLLQLHFDFVECMVTAATHVSQPSNIYGSKGAIQEDNSTPNSILNFEA